MRVPTPLGTIIFYIIPINTPFLLYLQDIDTIRVHFNNFKNILIQSNKIVLVVHKWGHFWMLFNQLKETLA